MSTAPQPTPLTELKTLFAKENCTDLEVFEHCIGLNMIRTNFSDNPNIAQVRSIANQLAEHMLVICIDTEHYTLNSDEMTEIGVAVLPIHHVRELAQAKDFGDHGENLMRVAKFHFWRLREKAHLHTTNAASKGPAGNRFGEVRFITFKQAREYLRKFMNEPIKGVKGLEGYNHPVVILGHSIAHDREHLNGKDLDLKVSRLDNIIRYIDTQIMTTEAGHWWNSKDPIGLKTLVEKFEFTHSDAHTAANDVGRTLICAFLLALPQDVRTNCERDIRRVASDLEEFTRINFEGMGGTKEYCCNCGSTEHMHDKCNKVGSLHCDECVSRGLLKFSTTHIALHCPVVRDEIAAERLAWYAGQPKEWSPKHPFSSKSRLATFAESPMPPHPTSMAEFTTRRKWYGQQHGSSRMTPFVWAGRSFKESQLANGPPPAGRRPSFPLRNSSSRQPPSAPRPTPAPSMPRFNPSDFPPLPLQNPSATGGRSGSQPRRS
jgi:hypothetical protein